MRTTVTLDPDTLALVRKRMKQRGISFKRAINEAIRAGLAGGSGGRKSYTMTFDLGKPLIDLTKANQVSADLDDAEVIRSMSGAGRDEDR